MSGVFQTALSGMTDSVARLGNTIKNLVNASSTGRLPTSSDATTTAYQPTDVVTLSNSVGDNNLGVSSIVVPREPAYIPVSDPDSPHADARGLVAAPNVDITAEVVNSLIAETTYGANAAVIKAERENEKTLLDTLA
ncbi:MAG: flagellar biosynthesis protein FlgC [Alphaproteobacteria bacterium]|nr:flagellar biosynthesis protein FlgC [Alphaproteobacteria bacterium]